jgi:class 3 adenylate cyclase
MLTKEQAIKFYESKKWETMSDYDLVKLQLYNRFVCIPFHRFHGAIENVLGHGVFTHEFAEPEHLKEEFERIK